MVVSESLKKINEEIRKKIYVMIPEKWDKLYLYASVIDDVTSEYTGEMFLYYIPKGILKKNPVNIYEVPSKFNIDESQYFELANDLYNSIVKLRRKMIQENQKRWSNLTISIEGITYKVEYNYDDLQNSIFTNEDRRAIWRFKYLQKPLESYNKTERKIINTYFTSEERRKSISAIYQESIYDKPVSTLIEYNKEEYLQNNSEDLDELIKKLGKPQIQKMQKEEKQTEEQKSQHQIEESKTKKNQILN